MDKIPITSRGLKVIEAELKQLKGVDRQNIIAAIAEARAHGDLSENAEYSAAKEKQSFIEGRIKELEAVISRADVIDVENIRHEHIVFGATVHLIDAETEEEVTYQIVGDYEADIKQSRISLSAPMARALIGKKVGDGVEVKTPKGTKDYEVLKVVYK